ncbi:MAG: Bax inhibitor-1/YccA family membrane protein [Pseudoclavibacter sp.]
MANSALKRNPYFNGSAPQQQQPSYAAPGQQFGRGGQFQAGRSDQSGNNPYAQGNNVHGGASGVGAPPMGGQQPMQQGMPSPDAMNHQYDMPSASPDEMDRMSYPDVIAKTVGLFAIVLVTAGLTAAVTVFVNPGLGLMLALAGSIGALVTGLILSFSRTPKPALAWAFAACEGLLVGGFSAYLEMLLPGIVMQATLATFAVVGTTLVLFRFGKVRTSPKVTKIVMIAMIGYAVFSLINVGYVWLVPDAPAWGMRSVEIFGIPLGVVIGILAVLLGAYMLVMDFEFIENGVKAGAPRAFGWIAAYSLVSTVVFIYIEILRLIAIMRGGD